MSHENTLGVRRAKRYSAGIGWGVSQQGYSKRTTGLSMPLGFVYLRRHELGSVLGEIVSRLLKMLKE
jgi:hypothetical protein